MLLGENITKVIKLARKKMREDQIKSDSIDQRDQEGRKERLRSDRESTRKYEEEGEGKAE